MSRWFRYYDNALNDPKVQQLPSDLFKAWVNLLCLASQGDGKIKSVGDAAFALRLSAAKAGAVVALLAGHGLLDHVTGGYFEPHNWDKRQFKSDVSNERVKRHRNAQCNVTSTVTETPPETEQIQSTDTEKKVSRAVAKATRTVNDEKFEELWLLKPSRGKASNPRKPAKRLFEKLVGKGTDPDKIIAALKAKVGFDPDKIGTSYAPMLSTWLSEERFDSGPSPPPRDPDKPRWEPPPGCQSLDEIYATLGMPNGKTV